MPDTKPAEKPKIPPPPPRQPDPDLIGYIERSNKRDEDPAPAEVKQSRD